MTTEPENLVLRLLREVGEVREEIRQMRDELRAELHDMRAEAAADRARVAGTDHAIAAVQRRQNRTDERVDALERQVAELRARQG
jgi:NTP pyrophosphatase (non-canonical NTP hydrolase)